MDRRKVIYVALPSEMVEKIDRLRKTEHGEIPRAEFIEMLLKKALEEVKTVE